MTEEERTYELVEALRTTLEMYGLPGPAVSWRISQANDWLARYSYLAPDAFNPDAFAGQSYAIATDS